MMIALTRRGVGEVETDGDWNWGGLVRDWWVGTHPTLAISAMGSEGAGAVVGAIQQPETRIPSSLTRFQAFGNSDAEIRFVYLSYSFVRQLIQMWDFLGAIWRFEYAVAPCILAYLVFDIPILYRRFTRRIYVPIYFAFFPFGYSDELYARYFDEDHYHIVGGPFRRDELANARIRIIWVSVLSLALTMAVSPFLAALFSHYFLTLEQKTQFFYTLALVKAVLLVWSLYNLQWHYRITSVVSTKLVGVIYLAYWVALLVFYDRGLSWIAEKDAAGGLAAIANGLLDFFVYDIGVGILFVGIIGFLLPWRLTNGTAQPIEDRINYDEE